YVLVHKEEFNNHQDKVQYIDDIFARSTFEILVESPVTKSTVTGKDRGIETTGGNTDTKDALIWNFSRPISFWSAKVLDLHSSSNKPAKLRLFDCSQSLIEDVAILYSVSTDGRGEIQHISFASGESNICHVSLSASESESTLAVDE